MMVSKGGHRVWGQGAPGNCQAEAEGGGVG